jgi:alpha-glucoside transport system permease protein
MIQSRRWEAWLFVGPALLLILFFLAYPAIATIIRSFFGRGTSLLGPNVEFVGLKNWRFVFTNDAMLVALRNNALWAGVGTTCCIGFGLLLAVLLDRVRYERLIKSIIFVPTAISGVGVGIIWKFMFAYRPAHLEQIGVLNAIVVAFGGEPVGWLIARPWINNFALIAVGIWMFTGFCMVILSAAYKNIPRPLFEAARIDGANERHVFRHIVLPLLWPAIAVVTTTVLVMILKIFDVIYVMTNGNFGTEVIANRMYKEMFIFNNFGRSGAIATVLFVLIIPFMVLNIRRFVAQEGGR